MKSIEITENPGYKDRYILESKCYISNLLINKINTKVKGVDSATRKGNYSLFITKAKLFEWWDVEKDLLFLLREEGLID